MINPLKLKVAIVTDSMTGFGGADRMMFSILDIFPNSEIYTSLFDRNKYKIKNKVNTSFVQKIPLPKRILSFIYPLAFEMFDLQSFDLVITLTAGPAKGIITQIYQPHITFVLTPPRHQWDREINVRGSKLSSIFKIGSMFVSHYLRIWDLTAIRRSGHVVSISKYIKEKIKRIYGIEAPVIYPGVNDFWYEKPKDTEKKLVIEKYGLVEEYLISFGRLYDHKCVDVSINACKAAKTHLYVIGDGPDLGYLKKLAGSSEYIHFLGHIDDIQLRAIISMSKAFVFPALEDFGYVTVEAQAQGVPAFVLNKGGSIEIVKDGKTGSYFKTEEELVNLISKKTWTMYNASEIKKNSNRFKQEEFKKNLLKIVEEIYEK